MCSFFCSALGLLVCVTFMLSCMWVLLTSFISLTLFSLAPPLGLTAWPLTVSDADGGSEQDLPLTWARSIPLSAASFLASGLANTRPFLGPAGAAAGAALGAGAAAWTNQITSSGRRLVLEGDS